MQTPDKWVILKINSEINNEIYKVFASWGGGYLDGDYWRINSGIVEVEEDENYYYFYGYSGSIYKCHKHTYGIIGASNKATLNNIINHNSTLLIIMNENTNWKEILNA